MEPQSGLPSAGKEQSSGAPSEHPSIEIIWKSKRECRNITYQVHDAMSNITIIKYQCLNVIEQRFEIGSFLLSRIHNLLF